MLDAERLMRIEDRQITMASSLAEMAVHMKEMNGSVADVKAEIGSVPEASFRGGRLTVSDRLHVLESDRTSAHAAQAALNATENMRENIKERNWTHWQKRGLLVVAGATFVLSLLRFFGL